tara:strand:+ start:66 stop:206 length:141 start_codon:yes stop_codon:yes gene_type:complete
VSQYIELTESDVMKILELSLKPENQSLFVNPISVMVKVGESEMENT